MNFILKLTLEAIIKALLWVSLPTGKRMSSISSHWTYVTSLATNNQKSNKQWLIYKSFFFSYIKKKKKKKFEGPPQWLSRLSV